MRLFFCFCFILNVLTILSQNRTISGYVKDHATGEVLIGATIYESDVHKGTTSNEYGYFSLALPTGVYNIMCSYMGYTSKTIQIELYKSQSINFSLEAEKRQLSDITIIADQQNVHRQNGFHAEYLSSEKIKQLPTMFGEADVIKVVQMQSGVKTMGDASSGMFVRGGTSDQNLLLIDEAPIYNPAHLFGLVSVFNADALNHATLYKSNMPAQYGGRVSSVIDCKMKEGNMYNHDFSIGLNPFAVSVMANGPIVREKASYFVAARHSMVDWFVSPNKNINLIPSFYDVNAKVNVHIGKSDRWFAAFYGGNDLIRSYDGLNNQWSNITGTLRWNHNFGGRWFMNITGVASDYQNSLQFSRQKQQYQWQTGITDLQLKTDLSFYIAPDNQLKFGVNSIHHHFIPGELNDSVSVSIPQIKAFEHVLFILHDVRPYSWLGLNYGLRLSAFQNYGNATWYEYNNNHQVINTNYNNKGVYNTYVRLEPRINVHFRLSPKASLKVSYARNAQYMQVLQNQNTSYTSLEMWFPTNKTIKPIMVDAISLGWFQHFAKQFLVSAEIYYKNGQNQIDYIDHAKLLQNPYIEGEIRSGKSTAYGLEINIQKEIGKLTGNISYNYSRVFYQIKGINKGQKYCAPSDIPHDFRIMANYQFAKNWHANALWMFMSGRPITLPIGFYESLKETVPIYTARNGSRMPNYHRMDISVNYKSPVYKHGFWWSANVGVFNVYAHKNPLSYQFELNYDSKTIRATQYTLFTVIPNIAFKIGF